MCHPWDAMRVATGGLDQVTIKSGLQSSMDWMIFIITCWQALDKSLKQNRSQTSTH